jgi:hypothetical protein
MISSAAANILRRSLPSCPPLPKTSIQRFSTKATVPPRKNISREERAALRQARKQQAAQSMESETVGASSSSSPTASSANTATAAAAAAGPIKKPMDSRIVFGLGLGVPTILLAWGIGDENSPPAQVAKMIGLTGLIENFSEQFAKPHKEKLLPNWPVRE